MSYATVEDFQHLSNKRTLAPGEADAIAVYLNAATENIDRTLNVYVAGYEYFNAPLTATPRLYPGNNTRALRIDAAYSVTQVETRTSPTAAWEVWAATDWVSASGSARAPAYYTTPATLLVSYNDLFPCYQYGGPPQPTVRVTARWGYSDHPPQDIVAACVEQATRWYKRAQSAMADTLADGDIGTLIYTRALDPDIERKLTHGRYMRPAIGKR